MERSGVIPPAPIAAPARIPPLPALPDDLAITGARAAADEAVHRAGLASYHRYHENILFDAVHASASDLGSAVSEMLLYSEVMGVLSGSLVPSLSPLTSHCRGAAASAGRGSRCTRARTSRR